MEYEVMFSFLVCVMSLPLVSSNAKHPADWLTGALEAASRETRHQRNSVLNSVEAGNEVMTSPETSCCLNGGTCVMNSFCHCPKNYYGRFCEHRVRHRSCGSIRHGTWMASGCHLCHCFDGQMRCKVTTIKGCDNLSYIEGIEQAPDYLIGIDQKHADYEQFYDGYYYDTDDVTPASGSPMVTASICVVMATIIVGIVS